MSIIYFEEDCTIDFNPCDLLKSVSAEAKWQLQELRDSCQKFSIEKKKRKKNLEGKIKLQIAFLSM